MISFRRASAALAALVAGAVLATPSVAAGQQSDDGGRVGRDGEVGLDLDMLRAEHVEVVSALDDVELNVAQQRADLDRATETLRAAELAAGEADAAVDAAQEKVDELVAATDTLVIEAFVSPQTDSALDALAAPSLSEATVKQAILHRRLDSDAALLTELQAAQDDLIAETERHERAAVEAEERRGEAEAALADVESAVSQQVAFVLAVEQRMDHVLVEAEGVAPVDPELAESIRKREAELSAVLALYDEEVQVRARQQRAAELGEQARAVQRAGGSKPPVPGGVATVVCPAGGSFKIAGDIRDAVEKLLHAAAADGVVLCATSGYRSYDVQASARRRNCGSSNYAIYSAPASSCSPPTARPGSSMHEQGLAVDFTCHGGGVSSSSSCFRWLSANAYDYGLLNLPSEPWHWSVNGR